MPTPAKEHLRIPRTYDASETIDVLYRPSTSLTHPKAHYPGLRTEQVMLKKETVREKRRRSLPCDILWDRDVAVTLRDGTVIYTDLFRPADTFGPLPAIVAWSPYGKLNSGPITVASELPFNAGIPYDTTSGYESFEAPDPAYWCSHGYAVLTPDVRGTMMSGGNFEWWGPEEAQDGCDFIEWTASQSWSNGKVGLTGNSQLAIMQWFIAALNPPHLATIAPWEGLNDLYRNDIFDGGIRDYGFNKAILEGTVGQNHIEDIPAMSDHHPLMNGYWRSKIAKVEDIQVPAYVVASWTNLVHTRGTLQSWAQLGSTEKWLRIHQTQEWPDYYDPANQDDLRKFYDCYLKDKNNDWRRTPRVRMAVLDPGGIDTVNRPVEDFPLPDTQFRALYLDATTGGLSTQVPALPAQARYQADPDTKGNVFFTYRFTETTEMAGFFKLKLWVEAQGNDDMDLYVWCQKLDAAGKILNHIPVPMPRPLQWGLRKLHQHDLLPQSIPQALFYTGTYGRQKVSLRKLDIARSTPVQPIHTFDEFQPLQPDEIVPVEISLWPTSMRYRAGEQLRLVVGGYNLRGQHLPHHDKVKLINKGLHIIHTGSAYDSHLLVPVISVGVAV